MADRAAKGMAMIGTGQATPAPTGKIIEDAFFPVDTVTRVQKAALDLLGYCKKNDWAGFDPYDGLMNPFFERLPFLRNWPARLAFIQLMKRSAVNLRPLAGVRRGQNPKALALFSSSLVTLLEAGLISDRALVQSVADRLVALRTPGLPHACWGYNFDWQSRRTLVPRYTPNVVCTSFAGNALLDTYDTLRAPAHLQAARSAGEFIMKGLNITETGGGICFSYTPLDRAKVHNANLLAASFLARLSRMFPEPALADHALKAARYSAGSQSPDGSWPYGENKVQGWIDNFHTGYNLTALAAYSRHAATQEFEEVIRKGFAFYRKHFFHEGCIPKYYHNRLYPIDIHSIAQSIVTLIDLKGLDPGNVRLAIAVSGWAIEHMRAPEGWFYYQKKRGYTNKIPYMRWSQAWMLYALAVLLAEVAKRGPREEKPGTVRPGQ